MELAAAFWENNSRQIIAVGIDTAIAVLILLVCALLARIVRRSIRKAKQKYEKFDETLVPVLSTTITYVIFITGIVFILDIFGVNSASIITILGTAGLAVGFALKDTLSNVAAGFMLLFLRPFRAGDFIEYGSRLGMVNEINLFNTTLTTVDGVFISAPNNLIWGSDIKNYSRNGRRRMDIVVGISYDDSIETGIKVLNQVASNENRLLEDPAPQVMVSSLGDSSVNLTLRVWADNDDYWQTMWDLNHLVKEEIEGAGLSIPYPQQDVHIISGAGG